MKYCDLNLRCIRAGAWLQVPIMLLAALTGKGAKADPPLPTFGPAVYNVTVSNPSINGGVTASTASSDNASAINSYVTYCSNNGGGTVEIPSGTFRSGTITLRNNVNLQIDNGSILRLTDITKKLITATSGSSNIQISGSGTIDGAATTVASSTNNLIDIRNVNTLAILGVTIQNAAHEHLVPIGDTNVSVIGVTINDAGTLAANGGQYLANTDAIDYAGSNFLFKNLNISCGDDDIVAKPASNAVTNIVITDSTIGAGHGISFGGGWAQGVTNVIVNNISMTGTDNGLRLKAEDVAGGDAGGGTSHPVKNVLFNNITMTNVKNPIVIDSFYNGNNNFPTSPTDTTHYPGSPAPVDSTTPIVENVAFENITASGSSNAGLIYGLNTTPANVDRILFKNVQISASSHMNFWYGTNIDFSGLTITVPGSDAYSHATPVPGAFLSHVTTATVPIPGDYNGDGSVDAADYISFRAGLGTQFTQADYDWWRWNFGGTLATGAIYSKSVPEPSILVLIILATLGVGTGYRGKRPPIL